MQIVMVGDEIVRPETLDSVHYDRGLFFGDGVYEVLRSYNGKLFAFDEHMERFRRSLEGIEITGVEVAEIREKVQKAFAAAKIANAKIYFHVTRGSGPRDHLGKDDLRPNFFLTIEELGDDSHVKLNGITVSTYPDLRWKRCDIKSLNLLANVMARRDAGKKGCSEAILVDDAGFITEGSASAFFAIVGKSLITTPLSKNILPSITRKYVALAAGKAGLEIVEKQITPKQAAEADELFIAVTTKDIVPVVSFDGKQIGNGNPGKNTRLLMEAFRPFTR